MKKRIYLMIMVFMLFFAAGFMLSSEKAEAASSQYKQTSTGAWTNGQYKYYIRNQYLYRQNLETGNKKRLCSLRNYFNANDDFGLCQIGYVKGCEVYLGWIDSEYKLKTSSYNVKTRCFKGRCSSGQIEAGYGSYVVVNSRFHTDVSPDCYKLYKINSDGKMCYVKKLASSGYGAKFLGGKLYYVKCSDYLMNDARVICCKANGDGAHCIYSTHGCHDDFIYISNITASGCDIYKNGHTSHHCY